ncbi:uncharacterized protein Z519_08603 [Cladophialophora bantiana CBS 173.52]|uniref:FAD-binding domain-containing protein n=1 Tax=Cladophialophora bantiana (strain ATCC 10958 / CBS 173.52 / CDC B-1940 / NIH 8579) TaxID=1442370 RepID=A0A0D2HJ71_CLAB1|nr:uncharacterized protein Z519_08603 [Cladophialophora bantiana CBS 173.52]KIW90820.1 hypothetical protein Z519_08603 [Cladophialophora bantiana CBS 173.52]
MGLSCDSQSVPRGRLLVIGAGYAGLATAIELVQAGFEVEVVEAVSQLSTQGDMIQIGSNATRVMARWGNVVKEIQAISAQPPTMTLFDKDGVELLTAPLPSEFDGYPVLFSNRGYIQKSVFEYAQSIGVKFRFGSRVKSYFEDDTGAGIIVGDERIRADAIIACDGIHSAARKYLTGAQQLARPSGFAVYRSWFSLDRLANHPLTKRFTESKVDQFYVWIGTDIHVILFTTIAVRGAVVFVTHHDTYEMEESWTFPGDRQDMLKVTEGWDPIIAAVIGAIPQENIIDWKLLWRDPIKKWVSSKGRIAIAGDAAHPHLPTSGSGAAQAIEDAGTLGALLDKLGQDRIPLAFQVFERIRYERTSLTQRMGWETRHRWHQTDWDAVKANPDYLKMPQPMWLYAHDARQYAYDQCDAAVESLEKGKDFNSTNLPEGYTHEDWTVEMMLALEKNQVQEHFYKVANR